MTELYENNRNKKAWIVGIIVIIILIIIGIGSYFIIRESTVTVTDGYLIGDTATAGPYNLTINKVRNTQTLGKTTLSINKTDNNFFIVNISVKNTSNSPISPIDLSKNIFSLHSNNKTYNVNDAKTMEASESKLSSYLSAFTSSGSLSPKINYSIPVVFETEGPITSGDLYFNINNEKIDFKI